jgi:hypothetical protein
MKFSVKLYRGRKDDVISHVRKHGIHSISFFCATTGFPVAAACVFVKEEFPEHKEEMERKLDVLKEFYGYKEIEE